MYPIRQFGRLALALLAGAFAAPTLAAQLPHRDLKPAPEIRRVDWTGVSKWVDKVDLQASIYTEPTRCKSVILAAVCRLSGYKRFEDRHFLNHQEFQRDVIRIRVFYYKHGYREAQVDTTVKRLGDDEVEIGFAVKEGLPTTIADFTVAYDTALFSARTVNRLARMKKGAPLDLFLLDSTRVGYQNFLWDEGYADALVDTSTVVDTAAHSARVQVRLVHSHLTTVGEITVAGTVQVAQTTVLNSLSFRTGDLFRRSAMIESQRNLYESNLFKLATFDVPESFDSVKAVNVLLREAPLHEAHLGGGFNTVDFLQTDARYTHYNLFGGGRRLDITGAVGNLAAGSLNGRGLFHRQVLDTTTTGDASDFLEPTWQGSIDLTQPSFLQRSRNSLSVGVFAQRRAVPSVVIDRGYGGNVTYTRSLGLRSPLSISYRFEETRVEAAGPYFCVNFGVCDTLSINALRSHQRLSPIQAQVQIDRTDQPLTPSSGYTARAQLEHASSYTASDYQYNRAFGEGTDYVRLGGNGGVLATHFRIGIVRALGAGGTSLTDAVLHPRTRFYAGGSQSVRGYGENMLGPRILTLPTAYLAHATTATGAPCDVTSEAIRLCDPNTVRDSVQTNGVFLPVGDDRFTPRALGGTSLIEGSVEYRFRLPVFTSLGGAVFLDGGAVGGSALDPNSAGQRTLADFVKGSGAITPGFGVRYYSSVGPIRVDVGFNPSKAENLPVVTEITRNGKSEIIPLDIERRYAPFGESGGIASLISRFTLHLSIGQAY